MSLASDPRFGAVERDYSALKAQLTAGQMTREQFEAALQKLMVQDDSGRYWMMGAETGRWYVYDNQKWVQADPPSSAAATPTVPVDTGPTTESRNDALTMASFTPPKVDSGSLTSTGAAASTPTEPDAGAGTTPPSEAEARAAGQTMPSFTPPKVSQPSDAARNAAMTMPSFTPPQTPIDKAVTMASFVPPKVGTPPPAASAVAKPAGAQPQSAGRSMSPVLVIGCLLAGLCIIGVAALALVLSGRFGSSAVPTIPEATAVPTTVAIATATLTTVPTALPAPATSVPTTAPIVVRTTAPTVAPAATRAPTVAPQATATAIPPTASATNTSAPPTNTPPPTATNTSAPPPTPRPPSAEFPVSFNFVGAAKWGNPDPNNCTTVANDKDPRWQFKWEISVTNATATTVTGPDWVLPTVFNNEGASVFVCPYPSPNIPPGQTAKATFAAYVRLNQTVSRIVQKVRNTTYTRCIDASWKETPC
jgi:hypothetical protein